MLINGCKYNQEIDSFCNFMTDLGVTPRILINVDMKRFVLKVKMPVFCSRQMLHRKNMSYF